MTLERFCDIVWLEIWDDCAPMSDHAQYREIVTKLFIEGKHPGEIFYDGYDDNGKKVRKRLGDRPGTSKPGATAADDARALLARLGKGVKGDTKAFIEGVQAAKQATAVASPPSGNGP